MLVCEDFGRAFVCMDNCADALVAGQLSISPGNFDCIGYFHGLQGGAQTAKVPIDT